MALIEKYKCNHCNHEFEILSTERLTTFVLHKPSEWTCPHCGQIAFKLNEEKDDFGGSRGGKF